MARFGDIDMSQHWIRQWLIARRHQVITLTTVAWSLKVCGIQSKAISQEIPKNMGAMGACKVHKISGFKYPMQQWRE